VKIAAEGLGVRYAGSGRDALSGVTMTAQPGTLYSVLGPNGSGKSTLMRTLLGVIRTKRGRALLDGRPATEWKRAELARSVGVVAQAETISFPLTVRQLVGMGRYPHVGALAPESHADRAAIRRALESCDVDSLQARDVTTLSGGELQRARIARALAQEPEALVLDEPTASLDIRHQMAIMELLRASADRGMTVLLVTHSLDLAGQFSDRMLLLSEGLTAAEGAPADVLRADVLTRVYGWPLSVSTDPESGSPRVAPLRRS